MKIQRDLVIAHIDPDYEHPPYRFYLNEVCDEDEVSELGFNNLLLDQYGLSLTLDKRIITVTLEPRVIVPSVGREFDEQVNIDDLLIDDLYHSENTRWIIHGHGHRPNIEQEKHFRGFFSSLEKYYELTPQEGIHSPEHSINLELTKSEYQELLKLPDTAVMRMHLQLKPE
ncbi:MAG: hypothetical protein KAT77_03315 [Nanoarchaeota archaeon]|nr:hypothetical protein [Nanoarchaeota archaeon]